MFDKVNSFGRGDGNNGEDTGGKASGFGYYDGGGIGCGYGNGYGDGSGWGIEDGGGFGAGSGSW